jgi:hypothetical protein
MATTFKTIDEVDLNNRFEDYYCANANEKLFKCEKQLFYQKGGGFGMNYKYCSSCYSKWNKLTKEQQMNRSIEKPIKKESICLVKF